ncbi:type VI secretion system-associated FHA domain protein TagH [Paraburkholderia sp. UCT31]|uniref:type VI secretion system-associated FHA domain protein TagH n=1 Tax=Paraburkholderia sp. UCT31 TaxID=2615209 RepID=UPI001655F60E|nr:type VI secretion system-associated FHA domain protein TagH [Paraburkholderia sp. UCT31]MBC8735912.1 type VI secretion system-associated FHA domain protein TagH [Paraburkholderia sp. UCT31]
MSAAQRLILSIEGEGTGGFDASREQVFDCRDGSIGRSDECDWVLGTEGVSRLHALVRYLNGMYFIEDRSTNGMSLNGAPLRKGDPAALKQGDRLQIDTFDVSVRLSGNGSTEPDPRAGAVDPGRTASFGAAAPAPACAPAPAPAQNRGPLDLSLLLAPRRATPAQEHAGEAEGLIPGVADGSAPGASLDPLALFDVPSSYADEPLPRVSSAPGWNHSPAAADRFRPPQAEAARLGGPVLPEDWDASASLVAARSGQGRFEPSEDVSMTTGGIPALVPAPSPRQQRVSGDLTGPFAVAPTHASTPTQVPPQNQTQSETPMHSHASPDSPDTTPVVIAAAVAAPAVPAVPTAPLASAAPSPAGEDAPELMEMFHIAVDAMMDVLRARAELKNSFRLPATLIQRSENNPLKFAPTAQEAVMRLLAPPDGGFLRGNAALNDAAADIRNHQMAMLAGVRSAFQSLLAHFDPAKIEREAEGSVRRLPLGGRPRHWERYKEQFEEVTRNPDECFRRLFGDEFARAYEEQLGRLKRRRNEPT